MTETPSRAGVIIAGGFSTRFQDGDKAVADLDGTPLIGHVADRLEDVTDELVVNCRAEQVDALQDALETRSRTIQVAVDRTPDRGPLAGIATGLEAASAPVAAVVACDMPFVETALLEALFERLEGDGDRETDEHEVRTAAVVPKHPDGWFQTTQAVYRTEPMANACRTALEADEGKILAALDRIEWTVLEPADWKRHATLGSFDSIDTRADLEAARARF
ncbi:molybdenum cofactor guanylyltransferase [Natronosalvus halobius]|uniref:molybdenum cofactor guanylyltransferase n=1 Tax=Natronosalvus halobius TaxID=2953746 RepID=UPI00209E933A|nr:molybdenum cofactor guanylyltransferase [Natronosalvus halobius]USZ72189.1 molybdenum cofactor guanylyltransferase [Natronosalvus halobius]